jgi:hypothetical protein
MLPIVLLASWQSMEKGQSGRRARVGAQACSGQDFQRAMTSENGLVVLYS